jgi:hypothetical protein
MNSIICEPYRQMCLYICVLVDQCETLAVTTRLTDTICLGSPYWDSNHQPLDQKAVNSKECFLYVVCTAGEFVWNGGSVVQLHAPYIPLCAFSRRRYSFAIPAPSIV